MRRRPARGLRNRPESAYCFKGMTMCVMAGSWLPSVSTDDDNANRRGVVEQAVFLEIMEGQVVNRLCFASSTEAVGRVVSSLLGRANLHEDNGTAASRQQCRVRPGSRIVAGNQCDNQPFQEAAAARSERPEPTSPHQGCVGDGAAIFDELVKICTCPGALGKLANLRSRRCN